MHFNGDFNHVRITLLVNGAAYLNKRRAIDILNIVLLVHVGWIAVACRVPEKQAVENLLSFHKTA